MRDESTAPQGSSSGYNCSGSPSSTPSGDHTLVVHVHEKNVQLAIFSEVTGPVPVADEFKVNNIPFLIGVVKGKTFVYGRTLENFMTRASLNPKLKKCWCSWELGGVLVDEEPNRKRIIYFNDELVSAPDEFLLGMFFKYLARLADNCRRANNIIVKLERVVFPVPPWFSSVARQMLKDAAQVAGFKKSFVVHDTTLLAYLHLGDRQHEPKPATGRRTMISIVENYGHVTIACYSGSWTNNFLQAEGYASTKTEAGKFERTVRKQQFKLNCSSEINPEELIVKHRTVIVQSLFYELIEKLRIEVKRADTEVLLLCTNSKWESTVLRLIECETYPHFGMHPHDSNNDQEGQEQQTTSSDGRVLFFSHLNSPMIQEILPLPIFRSSETHGVKFKKVWEGHQGMGHGRDVQVEAIVPYHDYNSRFYQKAVNSCPTFGIIDIRQWLYYKYSNVKVYFIISMEGIITLDKVEALDKYRDGKETIMDRNTEYKWRPLNLTQTELLKVAKNVELKYNNSCEYLESLEALKEELWRLSSKIAEMQWNQTFRIEPKTRVKCAIWEEVKNIACYFISIRDLPLMDENYLASSLAKMQDLCIAYFI